LRLIKYTINNEVYLYGTTLIRDNYPEECIAELYHARWKLEELYKISKQLINVEEFHSRTERGIKQEIYAHFALINIARFLNYDAKINLMPLQEKLKVLVTNEIKDVSGKKMFLLNQKIQLPLNDNTCFEVISEQKINFKNCLLVVSRWLYNLIFAHKDIMLHSLYRIINSIIRVHQRTRPNRHYPRVSYKPRKKWTSLLGSCTK